MKYNMTQEEIDDIVLSRNLDLCVLAAKLGFGLDILVNDDCDSVRGQVARQGYGLDKLINDESGFVRAYVAR
jgi:hypothetical protein